MYPANTTPLSPTDHELDQLLLRALDGRPQRRKVWAFLADPEHPYRAEPLLVTVKIVAEDGALVWHPHSGRTIGEGAHDVDVDTLRGDRVWWGPFPHRFARSRLRVELERQQLRQKKPVEHGLAAEVDRVLAGLDEHEKAVLWDRFGCGSADGDKSIRVLATFAPPRGEA